MIKLKQLKIPVIFSFLLLFSTLFCRASEIKVFDTMQPYWGLATSTPAMKAEYIKEWSPADGLEYDFNYDRTGAGWLSVYKELGGYADFSAGDSISFWFNAAGEKNGINLRLIDIKGNVFERKLSGVTSVEGWREFVVPFKAMKDLGWGGDGDLDIKNIYEMKLELDKDNGGTGSIFLDSVRVYQLQTDTSRTLSSFDFVSSPGSDLKAVISSGYG